MVDLMEALHCCFSSLVDAHQGQKKLLRIMTIYNMENHTLYRIVYGLWMPVLLLIQCKAWILIDHCHLSLYRDVHNNKQLFLEIGKQNVMI